MGAKPIAFKERQSYDPDTGEPGIFRTEWRLIPFNGSNPLHIQISTSLRTGEFLPKVVLEQRCIRRGKIETWQVFDGFDTETLALESIPHDATALDCPSLMWIQHERKQTEIAHQEELERERIKANHEAEERRLRGLSRIAWAKLYVSPRYRALCDEWNEWTNRPSARALGSRLKLDTEFMRLYRAATIESITVPAKRSAIRACLDYYEFMWKHREPAIGHRETASGDLDPKEEQL